MRTKHRHVASPDEVKITRQPDGETALIEYADDAIGATHFRIGPEMRSMTDRQILKLFNENVRSTEVMRRTYDHVAVEVPVGRPQIERFELGHQWVPRGDVLRCEIHDTSTENGDSEPVIHIDDHELSWAEFGRLLLTHAGWGMRVVFVPEDETHETPRIEVREPDKR